MKLTPYFAVYGAILSTIIFLWDIFKYYRDKPKLRVQANHRLLIAMHKSEPRIGIDMINVGKRPITIVASGFRLDTESHENMATVLDPQLPKELHEGQSHTTFVLPKEIDTSKVLCAWARDPTGREYRSKKRPFQLKD